MRWTGAEQNKAETHCIARSSYGIQAGLTGSKKLLNTVILVAASSHVQWCKTVLQGHREMDRIVSLERGYWGLQESDKQEITKEKEERWQCVRETRRDS